MFLDVKVDVLTVWKLDDTAGHIGLVAFEPSCDRPGAERLNDALDLVALGSNRDDIASLEQDRGDICFFAVHSEMAMTDELARFLAGCGEAQTVDHVVKPALADTQQV